MSKPKSNEDNKTEFGSEDSKPKNEEPKNKGFLFDRRYFWWRFSILLILFIPLLIFGGGKIWWQREMSRIKALLTKRHDLEALDAIKNLESTFGKSGEFEWLKGRAYRHLRDRVRAENQFDLAKQLNFDIDQIQREQYYLDAQSGSPNKLTEKIEEAVGAEEQTDEVFHAYILGLLWNSSFIQATNTVQAWRQASPDSPGPDYFLGLLAQYKSDWETAQVPLERSLAKQPDFPPALFAMAENKTRLNLSDEAVVFYREYLKYRPDSFEAKLGLALALQGSEESEEGLELLRDLNRSTRATFDMAVSLAKAELENGSPEDAIEILEPIADRWPLDIEMNYTLGRAYSQVGKDELSEKYIALSESGNVAIEELDSLVTRSRTSPEDAEIRVKIGELHMRYVARAEGQSWLLAARQINPAIPEIYDLLAVFYRDLGDVNSAVVQEKIAQEIRKTGQLKNALEQQKQTLQADG